MGKNHLHCYSSNTHISYPSVTKARSAFIQVQGYLTLAQGIYSFEIRMNVWNKGFFASLRKYLQACKQFLNEPHAVSLKEGKNPGQSQKPSDVIHRYFRNFSEIIGLIPRNIYATFCRLKP